ncbi:myosin tail domain protein [Ceratobasidium sp. AG-Ba]|nr:myosin tail domain protein [Ceratobasidium sp. AG-Ba]QRW02876.1 myosin tail domain protein [Ceratobasidium sp. AG-Ba]
MASAVRSSSRSSYRAPSPSGSVDSVGKSVFPVAYEDHAHSCAVERSRASALEKLSRGATPQQRTFSPGIASPSAIPIPIPSSTPTTPIANKTRRTSSFDKLSAITAAGATESLIPLPVRVTPARRASSPTHGGAANGYYNGVNGSSGIPEGVPIEFGVASPSLGASRSISPTRTLSRIPVSSVGHARTLADEGQRQRASSPTTPGGDTSLLGDASFRSSMTSTSMLGLSPNGNSSANTTMPVSPTPGYRRSLVGGGTTKVLADLQAHTLQVKSVLENTKSQLRSSQRTIAQLTRQTEDLKDGRERLRLENESLNNVVSRKERLLQELLERARKAENECQLLKHQLKSETSNSKKNLREMEITLAEAKAVAQRSEREYVQLRDAMTHLREGWRTEVESLREQMKASRTEAQEAADRQKALLRLLDEQKTERQNMDKLQAEQRTIQEEFAKEFQAQLTKALERVELSSRECDAAGQTAKDVADDLARLKRLIHAGPGAKEE